MAVYALFLLSIALAVVVSEDVSLEETYAEGLLQNLSGISENEARDSANDVVDQVLEEVNYNIMRIGLDPTELPDAINSFEWKILLITYSGELSFKNGWLQGLSSLKRYKNAKITKQGQDTIVDTSLQYSTLVFDYQYVAKFMNLGPRGYLDGRIARSTLTVQLRITPEGTVTLQKYKFNKLGNLSLRWSGNSLTDWMANIFTIVTKPFLKPILKAKLSGYVKETLEQLIEEHNSGISYYSQ